MSPNVTVPSVPSHPLSQRFLAWSAIVTLCIAVLGQFLFGVFLSAFYGVPLMGGHIESWNLNQILERPPVVGGEIANTIAFGFHALGAAAVSFNGGLQLLPIIRRKAPAFHRWNGRVFLLLVVTLSLAGFWLVWVRQPTPQNIGDTATSVNGLLILGFSALTIRAAMTRKFRTHERWALALFLVSNAQWFFRVGSFGFFMGGQAFGIQIGFDNPFFEIWKWGCFLFPLALLQLFFLSHANRSKALKLVTTATLGITNAAMAWGSFALSMFLYSIYADALL